MKSETGLMDEDNIMEQAVHRIETFDVGVAKL